MLKSSVVLPPFGLSELAPTNVDVWALMGAPFSSLPIPSLTKVANLGRPFFPLSSTQVGFFLGNFFFLNPHAHLGLIYLPTFRLPTYLTYLFTFRLRNYAPWPPPPLPTYLLAHPATYVPTYLPTFPSTYLLTYLHTKSPPR